MLLQFSVENFLSFREAGVLSMLAAEGVEHPPHMVMEGPDGKKVLRCAAVYGANAAGKSNLVKALEFGSNLARRGCRPGERIKIPTFKLDSTCATRPARFEWHFAAQGLRYSYGYEVDASAVRAEWLTETRDGQETVLFEREETRLDLEGDLAPDSDRRAFLRFVAEGTRANQLFLAEALDRLDEHRAGAPS